MINIKYEPSKYLLLGLYFWKSLSPTLFLSMKKYLVLFDFDGTLSDRDSLIDFFIFTHGVSRFFWNILLSLPVILIWKLGILDVEKGKLHVINRFYKNWTRIKLNQKATAYLHERLPKILRNGAIDLIKSYQTEGNTIVIVSANIDIHLRAFCEYYNLDLICTELQFENDIYIGRFATKDCNRQEKVVRVRKSYNKSNYQKTIAFGNSKGDKAMLDWADEGHYRYLEKCHTKQYK